MNVLILGASGFVGSNVYRYLKGDLNLNLFSYCRRKHGAISVGALRNLLAANQITHVVNCIGSIGSDSVNPFINQIYANVIVVDSVIQAINQSDHEVSLIHIGSAAECGFKEAPFHESDLENPTNGYGKSKLVATKLLSNNLNESGGFFLNLRVFNLFGPNVSSDTYTGNLFQKALVAYRTTKKIKIMSNLSLRDYVYVDDLSRFISELIKDTLVLSKNNCLLNFCTGKPMSMDRFASIFNDCLSKNEMELIDTSNSVRSCYGSNQALLDTHFVFKEDTVHQISTWLKAYQVFDE